VKLRDNLSDAARAKPWFSTRVLPWSHHRNGKRCAARNSHQSAAVVRSSANAILPARVASDIVSKNSDCRTGLLFPAA